VSGGRPNHAKRPFRLLRRPEIAFLAHPRTRIPIFDDTIRVVYWPACCCLSISTEFNSSWLLSWRLLAPGIGLIVLLLLVGAFAEGETVVPETRWTMINVSPANAQADCHLIEFSDGRNVLIEHRGRGGCPRQSHWLPSSAQITKIDLVVISHFHKDHYGRLPDLIAAGIQIGRVACNMRRRTPL